MPIEDRPTKEDQREAFGDEITDLLGDVECPGCGKITLSSAGVPVFSLKARRFGVYVECLEGCGYNEIYWVPGFLTPSKSHPKRLPVFRNEGEKGDCR